MYFEYLPDSLKAMLVGKEEPQEEQESCVTWICRAYSNIFLPSM